MRTKSFILLFSVLVFDKVLMIVLYLLGLKMNLLFVLLAYVDGIILIGSDYNFDVPKILVKVSIFKTPKTIQPFAPNPTMSKSQRSKSKLTLAAFDVMAT